MAVLMWLALLVTVQLAFLTSLWYAIFVYTPVAFRPVRARRPLKVGVVLGSGGHTSEMLRLIRSMPASYWTGNRPFYVVSQTDAHSASTAQEQELRMFGRNAVIHVIPRAREVGQSYASSVPSTLKAIAHSFSVVVGERPDVLMVNGPGVCVPIVVASVLLAALMPWTFRRPAILYFESFTCVHHVSLTGRLLAPFLTDIFTVYWSSLLPVVAALRWRVALPNPWGGLFDIGPQDRVDARLEAETKTAREEEEEGDDGTIGPFASVNGGGDDGASGAKVTYALVTVGSTRFDKLIAAMATERVCQTLKECFGVTHLLLQYGTSDFTLPFSAKDPAHTENERGPSDSSAPSAPAAGAQVGTCAGVTVEAFRYRNGLSRWVRHAALVVTHAGAGTILECLQARVPTVVVPNRDLMSDHQLELAEALAAGQYLFYMSAEEVGERLASLDVQRLRRHEGLDKQMLRGVLSMPLTGSNRPPME